MSLKRKRHTPLADMIYRRISESPGKAIPFSAFMEIALYHPEGGYYRREERRTGRASGDFYTSVDVGDCFGLLLGLKLETLWEARGRPPVYPVAEQGAHNGQLARDILATLQERCSGLCGAIRYHIVEPFPERRRSQERMLADYPVTWLEAAQPLESPGVFLCNELADAFPVHVVRFAGGEWRERLVTAAGSETGLQWLDGNISQPELAAFLETLGPGIPEGYLTEVNLAAANWFDNTASLFETGDWLIVDYGYRREEYYDPVRSDGTLRAYRAHRYVENPLETPGEIDLTAHVDFTRLEEFAASHGMASRGLRDQHEFLIRTAEPWLRDIESNGQIGDPAVRKRLRQFQTLTHPGLMGRAFKVLHLSR